MGPTMVDDILLLVFVIGVDMVMMQLMMRANIVLMLMLLIVTTLMQSLFLFERF
jgi:hypothetical protein